MADEETKRDYPYLRLARTRFLNFVFKRARPLGMSWKDFYESRAEKKAGAIESPAIDRQGLQDHNALASAGIGPAKSDLTSSDAFPATCVS